MEVRCSLCETIDARDGRGRCSGPLSEKRTLLPSPRTVHEEQVKGVHGPGTRVAELEFAALMEIWDH